MYYIVHRNLTDMSDSHMKVPLSLTVKTAKGHGMWHGKIRTTAEEM